MKTYFNDYSDLNEERFNEELIYAKDNDEILTHINNIFSSLESISGVEFLGTSIISDENQIPEYIKTDKETGEEKLIVDIEESRLYLINYKFKLSDDEESEIITGSIFFPKLLESTYFYIDGNRWYPIYQIVDAATYNVRDELIFKTSLMGLKFSKKNVTYYDINNNEYNGNIKEIDLFKNKLNFLIYFLANFSLEYTINFIFENTGFEYDKDIFVIDSENYNKDDYSDKLVFKLSSSLYLIITEDLMEYDKEMCLNIIDILKDKTYIEIMDIDFWKPQLGKVFTKNKNKQNSKGTDLLISYKRIYDDSTKNNINLDDYNKENIFAITRWCVNNFYELTARDNMDLNFKRIRLNEYLCYDLQSKMSLITYRLLNKSNIKIKDTKQLFSTLKPNFLVKKCLVNDLFRYDGAVNSIDLFNSLLKFSFRGPQGLGGGNKEVNKAYRGLHHSYIGKLGLTTASSSDPGMTGTFCPFMKLNGFNFSDKKLDDFSD
jgi:hypothetical protein